MKKHITRIQSVLLIAVGLFISNLATAQSVKASNSFISTATVKHIEGNDYNTLFQVKLINQEGAKFSISVKDTFGNELFGEVYQDKVFDKKFQFENLIEQGAHTITIKSLKGDASQTFKINTETRVIKDVVVKRL
jgi:hypothetical protein